MNVLVTGATKGIGRAIAERFAQEGHNLAICARNEKDVAQFTEELKQYGVEVVSASCDVSKREQVKAFTDQVKSAWKQLDILVNNAGFFVPGEIHNEEDGLMESQIETNLYSAYHVTRDLIELMLPHKSGTIFNIASIASLMAYPNGGSYSISKFAMLGFSKGLREEMKPHGIRVTSVMPGATLTASWEGVDLPESRFIDVKDIAELVYTAAKLSDRTVVEEIVIRPQLGDL